MPNFTQSALTIQENVPLAPYTTFKIGGPARYFCEVTTEAQLLDALRFAQDRSMEIFVLGGGSNVLIADSGFDGLVLHLAIAASSVYMGDICRVSAGVDWDAFVLSVCEQGISGVECLAGIPGLVGGTPVQNVGAYGQEVADTIVSVRALDRETLSFVDLSKSDCRFAYRRSIFNSTHRGRHIVTAVEFHFDRSAKPNLAYADLKTYFAEAATPPTPLEIYYAVREIRHKKGMLIVEGEQDCRSAGSFFKNPIVPAASLDRIAQALGLESGSIPHWPAPDGQIKLPAAWLLERAGFHKGFALGEAGISSRHTLALINRGQATAADIAALRDRIQREVEQKFGVHLEQEPVWVGL